MSGWLLILLGLVLIGTGWTITTAPGVQVGGIILCLCGGYILGMGIAEVMDR